jgi:hypothetical protein
MGNSKTSDRKDIKYDESSNKFFVGEQKGKKFFKGKIIPTNVIENINQFKEQQKKFDFRDEKLIGYRSKVEKLLEKGDTYARLNQALKSDNILVRKITSEKIESRGGKYYGKDKGKGFQVSILYDEVKNKFYLAGIVKQEIKGEKKEKVEFKQDFIERVKTTEQEKELRKFIKKKGFDYNKVYIEEDTEKPIIESETQSTLTYYETYYRYGIVIYRMVDGRKYEIIYQNNSSSGNNEQYQYVIAELKADILNKTGLTLEEWIHITRVRGDIFIEGGIRYKRTKLKFNKETRETIKYNDMEHGGYDRTIDFENI